jgi:hypothetical protein
MSPVAMQLTTTKRSLLALTLTGLVVVTACGDGDDEGETSGKGGGDTGGSTTGGSTTGGSTTGGSTTGGSTTGGSTTGGSTTGGTAGSATGGSGGMTGGNAGMAGGAGKAGGAGGAAAGMGGAAGGMGGAAGGAGKAGGGGAGGAAAGMSGMAGAGGAPGGMAGAGGSAAGMAGAAGVAGMSGGAGAGGAAGGMAGAGGAGGGGGQGGVAPTTLYDFESGTQGWGGGAATQSPEQHFDGANSLKITYGALNGANVGVQVDQPLIWPGTVLTFHAYLPTGLDATDIYFQAFLQADNYKIGFDTSGNSARTPMLGGWTTWTYTLPGPFPGGVQTLGFQFGDGGGASTVPAGAVYIDAITMTGGTGTCAMATPAGLHDFESGPLDGNVYKVDGAPTTTTPTLSQSTDRAFGTGTGSMKVSFNMLPAPTGDPTKRIVFIDKPVIYCGQTMTFHVFLPTGSDGLTFQVFSQYNNYTGFTGTGGLTVTRDAWNTGTIAVPNTVDQRGIERVGIEFIYTGTAAYTGDVYVDQVTW